ncbi:MAG: hypothetical protein R2865_14765 [Deinococcales bacterium]
MGWTTTARLVRSQVSALKSGKFIFKSKGLVQIPLYPCAPRFTSRFTPDYG